MNRLLKILLFLVAVVLVVSGAGVGYLYAKYPDVPAPETAKWSRRRRRCPVANTSPST
jgi:hypothetical protein